MAFAEFLAQRPVANRVAVLVAPQATPLGNIVRSLAPRPVEVIEDHRDVARRRTALLQQSKFARIWDQAGAFVRAVARFELAIEMPTGERYSACYYPNISAVSDGLPEAFVVDEDEISRDDFSSFIAPFARVAEDRRPRFVVRAKGATQETIQKLAGIADKIDVRQIGKHGLVAVPQERVSSRAGTGVLDPLAAYTSFGFAVASQDEVILPAVSAAPEAILAGIYRLIFVINSKMRLEDRSAAEPDVRRLLSFLDEVREVAKGEFRLELARAKALANLLHAYVFESSAERIRNALALAHQLDDPFLLALGRRITNLADGLSPSTLHWLSESERGFWMLGEPVQAIYAAHNRLLTSLSIASPGIEFSALLEHAAKLKEIAPYAERLSTIYQGVGMLHLALDDLKAAQALFEQAETEPGTWLHRAEARTSKLMCRHLLGHADDGELITAAASYAHQLGTTCPSYHHQRLFYNLLRLAEDRASYPEVAAIAVEARAVSPVDTADLDGLFARIAAQMPVSTPRGRYEGLRGAFFDRTLLAPACSFIWH